jgi:uncharacterized protein YbjT (DUF2867 family)
MKVFVAGATGAIGRSLVPRLVEAGHEVTTITRSKERLGTADCSGIEPTCKRSALSRQLLVLAES